MIIIYFAYPVYRFKADGYREPNEKKEEKKKKRENSYFHNKVIDRIDESISILWGSVDWKNIPPSFSCRGESRTIFRNFLSFYRLEKKSLKIVTSKKLSPPPLSIVKKNRRGRFNIF